jgi:hypothetical protein
MEIRIMTISLASLSGGGGGSSNDFTLSVGVTGNTTYGLDRVYTSGRYTLAFANSDTTYDIYAIAEDGTYAGYTNGTVLEISANFAEIVVLGAASNETIIFSYEGTLNAPSTAGDVATAGAFLSGVVTSSLPTINDTTVVNGGNFAANVAVSFIDQSDAETSAKNVVRSSSTQLVVTRPDAFSPDDSPYTVKVVNPGIPVPSGSDAYLLVDSVTAGTNPAWQTTGDLFYNIGAASPDITLLATDSEGTDIDYSVVSGTLPAGITLVEETGVLSGTFSGSASEGDSNSVTFKAIDTGGNFLNKAFNFVANAAPVWTTAAGALDPGPLPGQAYSFQLVASGGSAGGALAYTVETGSLGAGLSLSSSGLISGTSSAASGSVFTFTVRVTDAAGLFADREFTLTVSSTVSSQPFNLSGSSNDANITMYRGMSYNKQTKETWVGQSQGLTVDFKRYLHYANGNYAFSGTTQVQNPINLRSLQFSDDGTKAWGVGWGTPQITLWLANSSGVFNWSSYSSYIDVPGLNNGNGGWDSALVDDRYLIMPNGSTVIVLDTSNNNVVFDGTLPNNPGALPTSVGWDPASREAYFGNYYSPIMLRYGYEPSSQSWTFIESRNVGHSIQACSVSGVSFEKLFFGNVNARVIAR